MISLVCDNRDEPSDLIGCLTSQVFPAEFPEQGSPGTNYTTTGGRATMEPADVIAFALVRDENSPSTIAGRLQQQRKFSFPESFCLDQFVPTNHARVQDMNVTEGEILRETRSCPARPNVSDTQLQWPSEYLLVYRTRMLLRASHPRYIISRMWRSLRWTSSNTLLQTGNVSRKGNLV